MATTNGSTAIRDKILASLARYRALRIGKFPCAFWRLSSRPGLTAIATIAKGFSNSSNTKSFPSVTVDLYGSGAVVLGFIMEEHDDGLVTVFVPSSPVLTIGNVYIVKAEQMSLINAKSQDVADCLSKWGMGSKKLLSKQE
ncbi:hypothetical protein BMR11_11645 [Methylococcaceae bacterium CS5]|nr:hypothetical protein BMR11_11645 [Methylococcaceae bacterium CS5]